MKKKKILAILLTLLMVISLMAGCFGKSSTTGTNTNQSSTSSANNSTKGPSVVNIGLASDPNDLSPFSAPSLGRVSIMKTMYETLVDQNGFGGDMVGVLMKDYQKVSDLEYKLTLYDNIYDTAGNHLTASDVAFCYNTAIKLGNLTKLNQIASVTAVDEYTVDFKFKKLQVGDLAVLWSECPIVTQAAYEASKDKMATDPVGTGPYKMTSYIPGNSITFEKTNKYWQTDTSKINVNSQANVDKIVYQIIPDPSQQTVALETGKIDLSSSINNTDLTRFQVGENSKKFTITRERENLTDILLFNCYTGNPFTNKALRQAVAYAIDDNAIVKGALNGLGVASKIPGNSKYPDYNKSWDTKNYYGFDLNKAKELLAQAGYKPGQLTVNLMSTSDDPHVKEAQVIQAELKDLGINVKISSYDGALYNAYKFDPTKWDLLINQAASTDYIVNVWKLMWDDTAYKYGTGNFFKDDKMQSLLMTACSIDGHTQANVDAFLSYTMDQCYGIGLAEEYDNFVHSNKITKLVFDCKGFVVPGACQYSF